MKNLAIARRYAKALLLIGKEDGQAETYREQLDGFTRLLEQNIALAQTINNPLHGAADRRKVLQTVLDTLDLSKVMSSFLMLLFDKGRIRFIFHINQFYQELADQLKGIARASLISATALPSGAVEKIQAALSKMTQKEVILEVSQEPELIGGIITRIGDIILDGSIRTQLLNMKEELKRENL